MAFCIFLRNERLVSISLAIACFALPLAARGEGAARPPSYAHSSEAVEVVYGTIASFDGRFALQVRDDRGFFDNVQLVQGTIINPTGQRLAVGMRVAVRGPNRGLALLATQIDTRNVPPMPRGQPRPAAVSTDRAGTPEQNREAQRVSAEQMQRYRAEQEAYQRARAAYRRTEEAKARAAAQSLANKLARLHGGQSERVALSPPTPQAPKNALSRPVPKERPTSHPVAPTPPPSRAIAPSHPSDPVAKNHSEPSWFGWGNL